MGGVAARSGFGFQDFVLAERIAAHMLERRAALVDGRVVDDVMFGVEAPPFQGADPEWDLVQAGHAELALAEAKSGAVEAEDRWDLWRRVRRTAHAVPQGEKRVVSVRLIVNADQLPPNPDRWREVAKRSQTVSGAWYTPAEGERKREVRSADDFAREALHVLSSQDADRSPPLGLPHARSLLRSFSLDDRFTKESVEEKLREHLGKLSKEVGVDQLVATLRGELAMRAESSDPSRRRFSGDQIFASIRLLERLAKVDPVTLRHLHQLRSSAARNELPEQDTRGGLPYRSWQELQPAAARAFTRAGERPIAIVGRGGLGKTVVVRRWLESQRTGRNDVLPLTASGVISLTGEQLVAALDLAAFAARHEGRQIFVVIDAIENVSNSAQRRELLGALKAASGLGVSVCVSCRLLDWRSALGSQEAASGWIVQELEEWSEARVRAEIGGTERPNVGQDLLRLLGTPLLLDLFLRTFGDADAVPPGLQTRHGLLQTYWDRRLLPADDERSAERRVLILDVAGREAGGASEHTVIGTAAADLTSEGLFSVSAGGQRSFRHSLLRDHAMALWCAEGGAGPSALSQKLQSIVPALVQFGALRSVLESRKSPDVLAQLRPPLLHHAASVLSEFDDLTELELDHIVSAVPVNECADFFISLLSTIRVGLRVEWLEVLSRLPIGTAWAESASWLTAASFAQMVDAVAALLPLSANVAVDRALAARLRAWSRSPRLSSELSTSAIGDRALGRLAHCLVHLDPSTDTLSWLEEAANFGPDVRYWILSELPTLVAALDEERVEDDALIRMAYIRAAGLREEQGRLREQPGAPRTGNVDYDRVSAALLGEGGAGLLKSRPSVFVKIAAELVAGIEADESDERHEHSARNSELDAALWQQLQRDPKFEKFVARATTTTEAESRAFALLGDHREEVDLKSPFVVDNPAERYWSLRSSEYETLVLKLRDLFGEMIAKGDAEFRRVCWPAVMSSHSALLRACLLDRLIDSQKGNFSDLLEELLSDGRLYFLACAERYIQRAIQDHWAKLGPSSQARIVENIRRTAYPPAGNIFRPGPFVSALPSNACPQDMLVFLEVYRERAMSLELPEPEDEPLDIAVARQPLAKTWSPLVGLPDSCQDLWRYISEIELGNAESITEEALREHLDNCRRIAAESLPAHQSLLGRANLIEAITWIILASRSKGIAGAAFEQEAAATLARWAVNSLSAIPTEGVVSDCPPLEGVIIGQPDCAELWVSFASLSDSLLWYDAIPNAQQLDHQLFEAIGALPVASLPDLVQYHLLRRITGWNRMQERGRDVLRSILENASHGRVVVAGMRRLGAFEAVERDALFLRWLTSEPKLRIEQDRDVLRSMGLWVGGCAVTLALGTRSTILGRNTFRALVERPSKVGTLSEPNNHLQFVGHTLSGIAQALRRGDVGVDQAGALAEDATVCWDAIRHAIDQNPRADAPVVASIIFREVLSAGGGAALQKDNSDPMRWWSPMASLAMSVTSEGSAREVARLANLLERSPIIDLIPAAWLRDALAVIDRRVPIAEADHWWREALQNAAGIVERLSRRATEPSEQDLLYKLAVRWAAPPFVIDRAIQVVRALRN